MKKDGFGEREFYKLFIKKDSAFILKETSGPDDNFSGGNFHLKECLDSRKKILFVGEAFEAGGF